MRRADRQGLTQALSNGEDGSSAGATASSCGRPAISISIKRALPLNGSRRSGHKLMPEEATSPDLVELMQRGVDALNRRDLDEFLSGWAPDAVLDTGGMMGTFEDVAAIRGV